MAKGFPPYDGGIELRASARAMGVREPAIGGKINAMTFNPLTSATSKSSLMVDRLRALVQCESPSSAPAQLKECADLIEPWLAAATRRPVTLTRVGAHVHLASHASNPKVLVLGHFDTVWPIGTIADWPFTIDAITGIGRGPGVFDMKAGIVQALTAIELLADPDHVSVLLTSDEEVGSATSRHLIVDMAQAAGAVLVCEPTADGGAVKIGRKGVASYDVQVIGRAAHAGLEPNLGVNASIEVAHQIIQIERISSAEKQTSVVPTVLSAGTTANTVPEFAQVHVDARAWQLAELRRVDETMNRLSARLPGAKVSVSGGIDRPPFEESAARALYAEAAAAASEIGLGALGAALSAGGSDGNITAAEGIPTLDGLGAVGGHPHSRNEHVLVTAMPERAALLCALLARLAHSSPGG